MGCGALSKAKIHVAPELSVVPAGPSGKTVGLIDTDTETAAAQQDLPIECFEEDGDDEDEADDSDTDESIPGEPLEAKWARTAKRQKKHARQRRRAAKAAEQGIEIACRPGCISSFAGMRRPCTDPGKQGCFDRLCFLVSGRGIVEDMYDLSINLGKGTFGTVERCTHRQTNKLRAIKSIPKKKVYHPDRLAHEVEVMRMLEHPHILKLYETFEDDKYIYIIMELCRGGELLEKLTSLRGGGLSEGAVASVMRQVVGAVHYMHQQHVCHRDLKPENFLLMQEVPDVAEAHVKVIDFGFATLFEPGGFMRTRACTNNYVAPEVLGGCYNESCDIWSLGVIVYVLLSGQKPFWGTNEVDMLAKVKSCTYDFESPDCWASISEDAKDLIRHILVLDVGRRLSAEKALQHIWIAQLAPRAPVAELPPAVLSRLCTFNVLGKFKRAAATALVQQLHEDSIEQLRETFQALDTSEDGLLSIDEIRQGLQAAGVEVPDHLQQTLVDVDTDGSGAVDYTEFLAAAVDEKHCFQEAACWAAFRVFDMDGDGKITKDEIAKMLSCGRMGSLADTLGADRDEIEQAVLEADFNGDSCIDFTEFQALIQSVSARKSAVALPSAV